MIRVQAPRSSVPVFVALLVCALTILLASILMGSVRLSAQNLLELIFPTRDSLAHSLVFELRLPRALSAFALGGILALAGLLMQNLLRNSLADPFIMGASGGAAVAALSAMLLGLGVVAVNIAAAGGALAVILLVFALAHGEGSWTPHRLLLIGVVIAAGASALVSLLLSLGDEARVRGMLFWLMGDLSLSPQPLPLWLTLLASALFAWLLARHLNVLAHGELQALSLGLDVPRFRLLLFLVSSLLTAAAVTAAGTIGFVGLLSPHLARLLLGFNHRRSIPAAILIGGCLLSLADLAARTILAPRQLPVGALTALVGVPLFLLLMRRPNARATA